MTKKRNFNILDTVVLVAAMAVGIAGGRAFSSLVIPRARSPFDAWPPTGRELLAERIHEACNYSAFILFALGLAFLLLRLRKPRPRQRRLWHSPGAAACFTVSVVVLVNVLRSGTVWLIWILRDWDDLSVDWIFDVQTLAIKQAGAATLAIWLVLIVSRVMKLTRDWLEAFGLLVASGWILLLIEEPVNDLLWSR